MAEAFGGIRNDHYDDVLIWAISGSVIEMSPLRAYGYTPSPYTDFLTVDFVSTCKALRKQGIKDYYAHMLFKLIPYFKQQRKLDVIKAAKEIYPVSGRKVARQFVAAIMDAGMDEEVVSIKKISKEHEKLVNDIAEERKTAYSIYLYAPGVSSGPSMEVDPQESK